MAFFRKDRKGRGGDPRGAGLPITPPVEAAPPAQPSRPPETQSTPPRAADGKSRYDHRKAAGQRLLHIDLPDQQVAVIDREAKAMGMSRVAWIRALIALRLRSEPCFTREGELTLLALHAEARALRTELAMAWRRLEDRDEEDTAALLRALARIDDALVRHRAAIRASFEGNMTYWRGEP